MSNLRFIAYPAIAALSLFAAVAAHADDITPDNTASQAWSQTKTRAQVQAELFQARADGSIRMHSTTYNPLTATPLSKVTREEVRAQVVAERASDVAARLVGEDSGSFYLSQIKPVREAQRVLAAKAAR